MQEERLNLGPFVDPLLRWWRFILACVLISTMLSGTIASAQFAIERMIPSEADTPAAQTPTPITAAEATGPTPTPGPSIYEAVAGLSVIQEDEAPEEEEEEKVASKQHLDPLLGLVTNNAIAERVITELYDQLDPEERQPQKLLSMVRGFAASEDLIEIIVTHENPEKAALIANAWASAYEQFANESYTRTVANSDALESELARARTNYEDTHNALLEFWSSGSLQETRRIIREKEAVLGILKTTQSEIISSTQIVDTQTIKSVYEAYREAQLENVLLAFEEEQQRNRALLKAYMDAQTNAQVSVVVRQATERQRILDDAYASRALLDTLLRRATLLRDMARQGGDPAIISPALTRLTIEVASVDMRLEPLMLDADGNLVSPDAGQVIVDFDGQPLMEPASSEKVTERTTRNIEHPTDPTMEPIIRDSIEKTEERSEGMPGTSFPNEPHSTDLPNTQITIAPPTLSQDQVVGQTEALVTALETQIAQIDDTIQQQQQALLNDEQLVLEEPATESELWNRIRETHVALFEPGILGELSQDIANKSFANTAMVLMDDMLQLEDQFELLNLSTADTPLNRGIESLEQDIFNLRIQHDQQQLKGQELRQERTLALKTYNTLRYQVTQARLEEILPTLEVHFIAQASIPTIRGRARQDTVAVNEAIAAAETRVKQAESQASEAAAEARSAALAESSDRLKTARDTIEERDLQIKELQDQLAQRSSIPPVALGMMLGLIVGMLGAYLLDYLGPGAVPRRLWGPPEAFWNHAFAWALTPAELPSTRGQMRYQPHSDSPADDAPASSTETPAQENPPSDGTADKTS